jgi:hypothetical protein
VEVYFVVTVVMAVVLLIMNIAAHVADTVRSIVKIAVEQVR